MFEVKYLFVLAIIFGFLVHPKNVYCQIFGQTQLTYDDQRAFNKALDSLISKEFYIDPAKDLKLFFTLKIDSQGEIHSAHIRRGVNFASEKFYEICYSIETRYVVKFLFEKLKDDLLPGEKYVYCAYPYLSNRSDY